jgi:hypothetical protein
VGKSKNCSLQIYLRKADRRTKQADQELEQREIIHHECHRCKQAVIMWIEDFSEKSIQADISMPKILKRDKPSLDATHRIKGDREECWHFPPVP